MIDFRALLTKDGRLRRAHFDSTKRNVFVLLNKSSDRRIAPWVRHVVDSAEEQYNVLKIIRRADRRRNEDTLGRDFLDLSVICKRSTSIDDCIARLVATWKPLYALAFDLESTDLVSMLECRGVPVVVLVSRLPDEADLPDLEMIAYTASKIAYTNPLIYDAMVDKCPLLEARGCSHLPLPTEPLSAAFTAGSLAQTVDALGLEAAALTKSFDRDYSTIKNSGALDDDFYFGVEPRDGWRDATREYLQASKIAYPASRTEASRLVRRPLPGFHPLVYASHHLNSPQGYEGALAHYIRAGFPAGPWQHRVLDMRAIVPSAPAEMRVAVHAHFHYPELLSDLLDRLRVNETPVDLFLTTTSNDRKDALDHQLRDAGFSSARIDIVPNVGRDIGPLIWILKENCLSNYDLICHVHGKRSVQLAPGDGDTWRTFLWENLVGGHVRAVDIIAGAFAADPALGLLFAEENILSGWDRNRETCSKLFNQAGLQGPLPDHFDFPVGTMFWARPGALAPLRMLDLAWSDYPLEPIAEDGTLLHALERFIPFSAAKAGFDYATTYVKGISH